MILGIDPGPVQSAYCLWDGKAIKYSGILTNAEVKQMMLGLCVRESKSIVAIEHLQCFGMAVGQSVFETAYWIGEFRCTVNADHFVPVFRSEIKMHFCNSMRAKDANIRQALIDRFGKPGTKKAPGLTYGISKDIWSAFAIAVFVKDTLTAVPALAEPQSNEPDGTIGLRGEARESVEQPRCNSEDSRGGGQHL